MEHFTFNQNHVDGSHMLRIAPIPAFILPLLSRTFSFRCRFEKQIKGYWEGLIPAPITFHAVPVRLAAEPPADPPQRFDLHKHIP